MIWLVLFALSYVCGQEEVPRILIDASNFHGFPESFSSLIVQTNNAKGAKYHWLKDGEKITKESQPTFVSPFTTQLFIPNPGRDYAGIYQFVMTAPVGTIKGRKITVDFTYVGKFDSSLPANNTQEVVVGQANFVKCPKHEPGSNVDYKWGKSSGVTGTRFLEIKPNYIVLDNGTLFYSHLTEQNANRFNENGWTCGMEAKVKKTIQFIWAADIKTQFHVKDTNLTEFGPKIVTKLTNNKRFQEGHTIRMKCAAAGRPTPVYSWKRIDVYGTEFVVEDGKYGINFEYGDARLLVIKTALRQHGGRYFCTATIGDKNDTVEGSLKFEVKPEWIGERIQSVKPSIYSSHSWTCNATGVPMPTYEWHKDGNLLVSSAKHAIDGGTLTFSSLKKSDTGMYECVADNDLDNIYQTAYLDVQAEKPVFNTNTGQTTLFLGDKGVIKCHAKAIPAAENTWIKDGIEIITGVSRSRYTLVNDENLVIDSVGKQDIGNYTCKAENEWGVDIKKISVQVVIFPITFVEEPQDVVTTRGKVIKLKCRAEGDEIKYKWKYNGKDIELDDTIIWSDASNALFFLKTQVSQSGEYECVAYTDKPSYAEKKRKATVAIIRGPPQAPNTVKIDGECSGFSVKLTWHISGSNYEPVKNFIIQKATSYDRVWRNVKTVLPTEHETTISGLFPWTQYQFRVLAINEIGTSAPSETTKLENCKTPSRGKEDVPRILKDANNYHGFPEYFNGLFVRTNNVKGAKYYWLKDGNVITKESKPTFVSSFTTQLFIPNPGRDYAGIYQFVTMAPAGTIKGRKITVDFTYLGKFDSSLPRDNTQEVVVGQANFIKCPKHEPGSNVDYKWGKSSGVTGTRFLEIKPNYIVLDDGTLFYSHLTEQNLNHFNENGWTCGMEAKVKKTNRFTWAADIKTQFYVKDTNLTEFGPKIVTKLPNNKRFQEGHTIHLKCAAAGRPTPVYSWKRIDVYGTEFVVEDGKDAIKFEDGDARLLFIKTASRKHAGRYFCTATIGDKNDTVEGSLKFEDKPEWIGERIQSVKPSIYSTHSWTCNATGFPMPTYEWHKDGNLLDSSLFSSKHAIDGGTLTFSSLRKCDTGMYECVADNGLDNIYQTAYLDVQAEKPVFDTKTGKTTLFLGAKGVIKCHAKAIPAAENTWIKDGIEIITGVSRSRYTLVNDEDLVIDSVGKQDIGNYTCKAENEWGVDIKKISVQVVGEIRFVEEPQDVVTRGKQLILKCRAEGDKESPIKATIKYKWKYNGKDIELNDTIVWSDRAHVLFFLETKVSQSGDYECIAYIDKPSYAERKRKATVIILGPPEAPNTVKIDGDCSSFSAKLTWHITGSNYEPIKNFVIQKVTSYDRVWRNVKTVLPTEDEKTISGLAPWTQYQFRVLAINEIGTSAPSEPTKFGNCETPSRAPAKCPKIKAIPGKENQLTLKWEKIELINQNGEDFGYRLVYSSPKPKFSETKTFKPYELEFSIPNAGYYRSWSFKIQGYNKVGGGPFCEGTSYSGQNAPTTPPANLRVKVFGDVFFVLQWNEISLDPGSIDGYKLTYNQKSTTSRRSISAQNCDEKQPCVKDIIGSETTTVRLEGLIPYTLYRIAIRGYNSGGLGPESSMIVSTKEAKPGPPVQERVISYAKFIKLEWSEPHRPNGIVIGYNVSIDKDAKPRIAVVDGTAREYVFGGLVAKKAYVVHIQAKTAKGFGEKLIVRAKTTSPQVPAKPGLPVLEGFGQDGVNVTFREGKPEDARGYPKRFVVVYRVKDGKDNTWTQTDHVSSSKSYVEIRGLDKNREYEMATIAVNEEGKSETSDVQTVRPGDGKENATPTTPAPMQCSVTKLNLMFLVDGSGSVPAATFREFKEFMKLLVEKFDIGEDTTHVGVLQYSSKPRTGLEFHFTEHQTLAAVQDAISRVVYHYGAYTFGGYAMNLAQQIMNRYARADAKNVWVLLMDDGLWDKRLARKISKSIRQSGTKVIVLDTGNIMHDIADQGLGFSSENLKENVETVAQEICK